MSAIILPASIRITLAIGPSSESVALVTRAEDMIDPRKVEGSMGTSLLDFQVVSFFPDENMAALIDPAALPYISEDALETLRNRKVVSVAFSSDKPPALSLDYAMNPVMYRSSAQEILQWRAFGLVGHDDIVSLLAIDHTLIGLLYQHYYNSSDQKDVATPIEIIQNLGMSETLSYLSGAALLSNMEPVNPSDIASLGKGGFMRFRRVGEAALVIARTMNKEAGFDKVCPDLAYWLGLMTALPSIAWHRIVGKENADCLSRAQQASPFAAATDLEASLVGFNQTQIGRALLLEEGVPELIVNAITEYGSPGEVDHAGSIYTKIINAAVSTLVCKDPLERRNFPAGSYDIFSAQRRLGIKSFPLWDIHGAFEKVEEEAELVSWRFEDGSPEKAGLSRAPLLNQH